MDFLTEGEKKALGWFLIAIIGLVLLGAWLYRPEWFEITLPEIWVHIQNFLAQIGL